MTKFHIRMWSQNTSKYNIKINQNIISIMCGKPELKRIFFEVQSFPLHRPDWACEPPIADPLMCINIFLLSVCKVLKLFLNGCTDFDEIFLCVLVWVLEWFRFANSQLDPVWAQPGEVLSHGF